VVLKRRRAERPDPATRSGIALDLRDAAQLQDAVTMLERRAATREGAAGFLVQRQSGRARELRIQAGETALFGPVIRFGQGGTAADALHDVAVDLPPLNLPLARGMIARTRAAALLGELHDQKAADLDAVAGALVRVSQLLVDFPEIAEIDLNPLFASPAGVMAADAWISLRPPDEIARLAITPYPEELVARFEGRTGPLLIRPIRPEDAAAHAAFFARLPPEDVRYRFFSALRELSPELTARLTQVDYEREMAFVAVRESTGETVGVARLVHEFGSEEGEFAIAVQPDTKGSGLARHLMERLIDWGRSQGLHEIVGQVLSDNHKMLRFVRGMGFAVKRVPDEPDIVEARMALQNNGSAGTQDGRAGS
jgi:acetyltransferase